MTEIKQTDPQSIPRKRGRPQGSKNKKKKTLESPKRMRGRPKGSKNKNKKTIDQPKRKRGRPRKDKTAKNTYPSLEGVRFVRCKEGMKFIHGWVAFDGEQVIGYYKTQTAAHKAYKERCTNDN